MAHVSARISPDLSQRLDEELTIEELRAAAKDLEVDRAPGPDGVSIAFYKHHWDLMGEDFLKMVNSALSRAKLPSQMTQGAITLIHKSGPTEELGNWQPITLFNTAYKILAKALQLRLKPLLPEIVSSDQTAFVSQRFILDNVFVTQEVIDISRRTKQPLLLLKVDFKKAFDKVSWPFLFASMRKLGIGPRFVALTELLFNGASASLQSMASDPHLSRSSAVSGKAAPWHRFSSFLWQRL